LRSLLFLFVYRDIYILRERTFIEIHLFVCKKEGTK